MTTLADDNGNYLDYSGEDFSLKKQCATILNEFSIKGNASVNFKLDNTAPNRKKLGYYGPNQISSPVLTKIPFNISRNGNMSDKGYIVIQKITPKELECYFISGNANWFADFQFNIQEMDLSDFTTGNMLWDLGGGIGDQVSANSGIVFPFVDWVYKRNKFSSIYCDHIYQDAADPSTLIEPNAFSDFYPCFYLKNLVDYIFRQAGYKYSGNLFTDNLYLETIITPNNGDMSYSDSFVSSRSVTATLKTNQVVTGGVATTIQLTKDIGTLFDNATFKWTLIGKYSVEAVINITTNTIQNYTVTLNPITSISTTGTSAISYTISGALTSNTGMSIIILGAAGFTITSATVFFRIKKNVRPDDYIQANVILPSLKGIEVLKSTAIRFGCLVTFNETSRTVGFNQLDKIIQREDWSEYLVSFELIYQNGHKNNYIKVNQTDDLSNYNASNKIGFGETNLDTDFTTNIDNTLYQDPFGSAMDSLQNTPNQMVQSYIPLINLSDSDQFTITSISSSGGYAQLNGTFDILPTRTIVRVNDVNGVYTGYHVIGATTATTIILKTLFTVSSTGYVYKQNTSFNEAGSRLLLNVPNYPIRNLGKASSIDIDNGIVGGTSLTNKTSYPFAYFSKPTTGNGIDTYKESLSYGALNLEGYNDTPLDGRYSTVKKILNGPIFRGQFLLPESVFSRFNFDRKIDITCEGFTGQLWVDNFSQYKDSNTEVEIDLLIV